MTTALLVGALGGLLWTLSVHRLSYRAGRRHGYREGLEAGHLDADEQRAGVGPTRPHFWCADCGVVGVDEDGCCRTCGRTAMTVSPYPAEGR